MSSVSEQFGKDDQPADELADRRDHIRRLEEKNRREMELQPYQVELLKLQRHLEEYGQKMLVLFEGAMLRGRAARFAVSPGT
jgi:polyphosphate kinase 2 (PPK2 family)